MLRLVSSIALALLLSACAAAIPLSFGVVGAACVGDLSGVLNTDLCNPEERK